MDNIKNEVVMTLFRKYIKENLGKELEELELVIYGLELQVCGGILKYIDRNISVKLINYDLRTIGYSYDEHECELPETYAPYSNNTVVLVSLLYDYQYDEIADKLIKLGISSSNIIHARPLAESLLKISADYFAQNKMDLKVKELYDKIGRDISTIKYIDVGTNNYLLYNNTYLFYRAGARGVLVEANPDFADILRSSRPEDTILMCGCSESDTIEEMTYYKTNRAGYNTFVEDLISDYENKGIQVVEKIIVPMLSINRILEQNFPDGHVDFMSMDIEGMGDIVVNSIDFNKFEIDVLLLEMEYNSELSRNLFIKLHELGYESQFRGIGGGKDFLFYKKAIFNN
jgi:hypothetical protein